MLDAVGNIYFAEPSGSLASNYYIRKVSTNGIISTVAGDGNSTYNGDGGPATSAGLNYPFGVVVDPAGRLFISEYYGYRIRMVNTNGIITTVAGNGSGGYAGDGGAATNASLNSPSGMALDSAGNLFIADLFNSRIREVHFAGFPTLTFTNVSTANIGNYSVVITSPYGTATSSNAVLTVLVPPTISAWSSSGGACSMSWTAQSNFTYQLQFTTNLVAPVWQNLGDPITATNGTVSASDAGATDAQRFYRVQLVK